MRFTDSSIANMKRLQEEAFDQKASFDVQPSDAVLAGGAYDPLTEITTAPSTLNEKAAAILGVVQVDNDPKRFAGVGLAIESGVTLKVQANGTFVPVAGMLMTFPYPGGQKYEVKDPRPVMRRGAAQLYTVIGKA